MRGRIRRLTKRGLRSAPVRGALARLVAGYVRLVERTTRWQIDDRPLRRLVEADAGGIACFWHGRMMLLRSAWTPTDRAFHILVSLHRDGDLVGRVLASMGIGTVGADKKTGGVRALRAAKRLVDAGGWVGVTPDGPKGPRMRARGGAVKLAQLTGRPLLPVSIGLSRRRVLGSWDRFCLALPFGRAEIRYGTPVAVPREADGATLEACRRQLEDELNRLTRELDRAFGHPPVDPAAGPAPERLDVGAPAAAAREGA